MQDASEQIISSISKTLEEIKKLQNTPADDETIPKLFDALNLAAKYYIERNDIPSALTFIREMEKFVLDNEPFQNILGWDIFHSLKVIATDDYAKRHYSKAVPELINRYIAINIVYPSQLHSAILSILTRLSTEDSEWYLPFVRKYGFESLQESDYHSFAKDGKKVTPLAETLFLKLAKTVERSRNTDDTKWLFDCCEKQHIRFAENQWIIYYRGKFLFKLGQLEEAKRFAKEILQRNKHQFWAWAIFGATYKDVDNELYIACLCKALSFPTESALFLIIREELAFLLKGMNYLREAKTEFEIIISTRHLLEMPIPEVVAVVTGEPWYAQTECDETNLRFYLQRLPDANKLTQEDTEPVPGIVTAFYESNRGVFIQFGLDKVALYRYTKSPDQAPFAIGDTMKVWVQGLIINGQQRYEALRVEPECCFPAEEFARKMKGELKVPPQKGEGVVFGFISDAYVPPDLINNLKNGTPVTALVVKEFNKRRNQYGWRAIAVQADTTPAAKIEVVVEMKKFERIQTGDEIDDLELSVEKERLSAETSGQVETNAENSAEGVTPEQPEAGMSVPDADGSPENPESASLPTTTGNEIST